MGAPPSGSGGRVAAVLGVGVDGLVWKGVESVYEMVRGTWSGCRKALEAGRASGLNAGLQVQLTDRANGTGRRGRWPVLRAG